MADVASRDGVVYTETIVHSPPERYAADAPYQLAIVDVENGDRLTVRILRDESGESARIGERVVFVEDRGGVSYYRKETAGLRRATPVEARPLV